MEFDLNTLLLLRENVSLNCISYLRVREERRKAEEKVGYRE